MRWSDLGKWRKVEEENGGGRSDVNTRKRWRDVGGRNVTCGNCGGVMKERHEKREGEGEGESEMLIHATEGRGGGVVGGGYR